MLPEAMLVPRSGVDGPLEKFRMEFEEYVCSKGVPKVGWPGATKLKAAGEGPVLEGPMMGVLAPVPGGLLLGIFVMVRPAGTLTGPPDLRFFVECPLGSVGEAGRERFRGVVEAVLCCERPIAPYRCGVKPWTCCWCENWLPSNLKSFVDHEGLNGISWERVGYMPKGCPLALNTLPGICVDPLKAMGPPAPPCESGCL